MRRTADPRRTFLLDLLEVALVAVDGRRRMRAALSGAASRNTWVLAVGKAASAMTLGVLDALDAHVSRALVVSRAGHFDPELERRPGIECIAAGHPLPDAASLAAGESALAMAGAAPVGQRVILLVSGGASSLFEAPAAGVSLDDLQRLNAWALGSGLDIEAVNGIRRRLSRVKDGRLLAAFAHCDVEAFFISDVPGDDPALVGSGLLAASDRAPVEPAPLPGWVRDLLARAQPPSAVARPVSVTCVGSLAEALAAVEQAARAGGVAVHRHPTRLAGDAMATARRVCEELAMSPEGVHVYGGETTVVLPQDPGRGGRNQHLALAAACQLAGREDLVLLASATDGSDGNTADAGALVDGATIERGREAGLDAQQCLARADSGRFLEAAGDLVHTGPTGTNVGDLVIAVRREPRHSPLPPLSM